ncbi:hypothetical protein HS7_14870 [Sulfolobales archaeon HS-7]|nr:hypothetical protein HS7_14870 [Sulfolobales archaeon HS-7]
MDTTDRKLTFLKFFGPAWLVMIADMDASSTIGAAETGAAFGYKLVWFMLALIVPLYFIQEGAGRIGVATGKGLGEIIRENYSRKNALLMSLPMALTDVVTYVVEYLGIAIGFEMIGIPEFFLIAVFVVHIGLVISKKYVTFEKWLIFLSLILVGSFAADLAVRGIRNCFPIYFSTSRSFLFILAADAGAVIMPFMLFFQASATAEKRVHFSRGDGRKMVSWMRIETLIGAVVTELLMVIVEMATTGLSPTTNFASAIQLSKALTAIAGSYSPYLFGIGLIFAGFIALVIISLGSAWGTVEAIGLRRERAFWIYVIESIPALLISLMLPQSMLVNEVLNFLVFLLIVLIGPGVIMGLVLRNKTIMREYASSFPYEIAYWFSFVLIVLMGLISLIAFL